MKYALVGASGFFGTRFMESVLLEGIDDVRALVRQPAALARLARLGNIDHRLADALDSEALAKSVHGCDVIIHAMVGDPGQMVRAAEIAAQVSTQTGIRLIYLSSASVHGQNPPPGTDESSALNDRQLLPYNNAKVLAERAITRSGASAVILRPGIVYGPRSQWTEGLRKSLKEGRAFLVEGGTGVCNHIYVDNLVQAVRLAAIHPRAIEGPFYVADSEARTWKDFYRPLVEGWGHHMEDLWNVPAVEPMAPALRDRIARLKAGPISKWLLPRVPRRVKDAAKAAVDRYSAAEAPSGFALPRNHPPTADFETSELHRCMTRLPADRVAAVLGFRPTVDVADAMKRLSTEL